MPLGDIRVVDLTLARAGPTCVRQLADWGADVIRVEPRDGRVELGTRHGSDFQNLHRNKRSVTLNLKSERGRELLLQLVARSDVVVENMRPDVKHRLGVDYDSLRAVNPRIVYGSISGFGQEGPGAARGGVDQIAQGMGGLMSVTGFPGGGPLRTGVPIADLAAGLYCAIGILVALHERERTGEGRWVQTSLLESAIAMLDFQASRWTIDGEVPPQEGNHHPTMTPVGCFETADGHVNVAAWDGPPWEEFARIIGRPKLLEDPRFATAADRSRNRTELNAAIGESLRGRTTAEWVAACDAARIPVGAVYNVDEVFADPQVEHLDLVRPTEHSQLGVLNLIRNAVTIEGVSDGEYRPTPEAGEHSEEVLVGMLGLSSAEIEELRQEGVV